jgi:hypothetical protein
LKVPVIIRDTHYAHPCQWLDVTNQSTIRGRDQDYFVLVGQTGLYFTNPTIESAGGLVNTLKPLDSLCNRLLPDDLIDRIEITIRLLRTD